MSSGGTGIGGCTLSKSIEIPDGATTLEIKYNFVSQEYSEWVGSAYNDTFTVSLKGSPYYTVNRSVNNVASANDWNDILATESATDIAGIGESNDAAYNGTINGAYKFDGKLKYGESTGCPSDNNVGKIATMSLPSGQTTVMIVISVNDVADKIYDSAGLIDWIRLR